MAKIFIVEDDANILAGLEAKFGLIGLETDSDNGLGTQEEILALLVQSKPDYIILDLILPNIDGFDMLKAIKAEAELAKTKIFVFTYLSDTDSRTRGAELGADFYFIKSELNLDEFVSKISKIISNQSKTTL